MSIASLQDLLVHELKDLYSAETQLVKALPRSRRTHPRRSCRPRSPITWSRQRNTSPASSRRWSAGR